ncbi:hypothetical protein BGX28_009555 [Mortierella sp. GBA30]|nr:hypothetical protein BGX28_009555 [Mortierella sp. GBA30]
MSTPGPKIGPNKRSTRSKGPNRGQAKTKIVVRRLPANLPEHIFLDSIKTLVPDQALERATTWVSGKVSKNPVKGNTSARAYIYFKNEKLAMEFKKVYHGHVFVDKNGNEGRAHVEFAPFQKIPREQRKPDAKQGTIEEDPDYIAFLEALSAEPTEAEKEMKMSETEQLLKESAVNPKSTALLEDLRAKKAAAQAKAQAAKLAARQARQAGKAGISSAGKAQITILSNRNAKDSANARISSGMSAAAANKNQQGQQGQQQVAQSKKAQQQTPIADNAPVTKPKRERKRRDRASKRAANEAASSGNAGTTAESTTPQIMLLKPKPAANVSVNSADVQSPAVLAQAASQGYQGPTNAGTRRGQHAQQQPTGILSPAIAKKDNTQQSPGAEGTPGRSGRTRRGGRGGAKQEAKAGTNAPPNSSGTSSNTGGNSTNAQAPGSKPSVGQGTGASRSGRSRRGRGGAGQENSAANTVKE